MPVKAANQYNSLFSSLLALRMKTLSDLVNEAQLDPNAKNYLELARRRLGISHSELEINKELNSTYSQIKNSIWLSYLGIINFTLQSIDLSPAKDLFLPLDNKTIERLPEAVAKRISETYETDSSLSDTEKKSQDVYTSEIDTLFQYFEENKDNPPIAKLPGLFSQIAALRVLKEKTLRDLHIQVCDKYMEALTAVIEKEFVEALSGKDKFKKKLLTGTEKNVLEKIKEIYEKKLAKLKDENASPEKFEKWQGKISGECKIHLFKQDIFRETANKYEPVIQAQKDYFEHEIKERMKLVAENLDGSIDFYTNVGNLIGLLTERYQLHTASERYQLQAASKMQKIVTSIQQISEKTITLFSVEDQSTVDYSRLVECGKLLADKASKFENLFKGLEPHSLYGEQLKQLVSVLREATTQEVQAPDLFQQPEIPASLIEPDTASSAGVVATQAGRPEVAERDSDTSPKPSPHAKR